MLFGILICYIFVPVNINYTHAMEWIKVEDRLPYYDISVLWHLESGYIFIDDIDHDSDWETFKVIHKEIYFGESPGEKDSVDKITHWMPLPEPPND